MSTITAYANDVTRKTKQLGDKGCLALLLEYRNPETPETKRNDIKKIVTESNLRLVMKIAHGYTGMGLGYSDIVQLGNMGLMDAVDSFDPDKSPKFSVYAGRIIRNSIQRNGLDRVPMIYKGPWGRRKNNKAKCQRDVSIDEQINEEDTRAIGDTIEDENSCFTERIEREEQIEMIISKAREVLNDKEYVSIMAQFGRGYERPMNQIEIAQMLKVTHQRVQQLQKEGMKKLKAAVMEEYKG